MSGQSAMVIKVMATLYRNEGTPSKHQTNCMLCNKSIDGMEDCWFAPCLLKGGLVCDDCAEQYAEDSDVHLR